MTSLQSAKKIHCLIGSQYWIVMAPAVQMNVYIRYGRAPCHYFTVDGDDEDDDDRHHHHRRNIHDRRRQHLIGNDDDARQTRPDSR